MEGGKCQKASLGGKFRKRTRWEEKETGEEAERNMDVLRGTEMNKRWRETDRIER